jgi:hypothetical protein
VLLFCIAVFLLISGSATISLAPFVALALIYELTIFAIGVAPVGRLIYVEDGSAEEALSAQPLRAALRPGARGAYTSARLRSLPAYVPALLLMIAVWGAIQSGLPGAWAVALLLLWLAASAVLYAHLVVAQLYAMAERVARYA